MKLKEITQEMLRKEYMVFYDILNTHVNQVSKVVSRTAVSIPRYARMMGNFEFPYFYAGELDILFRYVLGTTADPAYIERICQEIVALFFTAPIGFPVEVNWKEWAKSPLGCIVQYALTKSKMDKGEDLTEEEAVLLLQWTPKRFLEFVSKNKVPARKVKEVTYYKADLIQKEHMKFEEKLQIEKE